MELAGQRRAPGHVPGFFSYFNLRYLYIICASMLLNYFFARLLLVPGRTVPQKKWLLFTVISLNLLILFYFKYFNFFIEI
jgi:hypothetical protein